MGKEITLSTKALDISNESSLDLSAQLDDYDPHEHRNVKNPTK